MSGGGGKRETAAVIRDTAAAVCLETFSLRTAVGAGGEAVLLLLYQRIWPWTLCIYENLVRSSGRQADKGIAKQLGFSPPNKKGLNRLKGVLPVLPVGVWGSVPRDTSFTCTRCQVRELYQVRTGTAVKLCI